MIHDTNTPMARQLKDRKIREASDRRGVPKSDPPPPGIHSKYSGMTPNGPNIKPPLLIPKGAGRNDGF